MADKKPADRVIAQNKKAFHDYFIDEEFEAGIELLGTEVKSVRAGKINLKDSYVSLKTGEAISVSYTHLLLKNFFYYTNKFIVIL